MAGSLAVRSCCRERRTRSSAFFGLISVPTERLTSNGGAFVPIHMDAERVGWWGDHNTEAFGRLRVGVTPQEPRAELDVLQAQVSDIATKEAHEPVTLASSVTPLAETLVGKARRGLLLLLGAIGAVLLIACSNLANLSLTRAVGHLRDAGIRSALGASRSRLVARATIEQLVLAGDRRDVGCGCRLVGAPGVRAHCAPAGHGCADLTSRS
jgi:HAMP domain-containing protein